MNEYQKKAVIKISIITLIIISLASIIIFVFGYVSKDETLQLIGLISTIISPSTLFGMFIKYLMNKSHLKQIDNKLISSGVELTPRESQEIEKEYKNANTKFFRVKNYLFIEKENKIIIKFDNENLNQQEIRDNFIYAFQEFMEFKRKQNDDI